MISIYLESLFLRRNSLSITTISSFLFPLYSILDTSIELKFDPNIIILFILIAAFISLMSSKFFIVEKLGKYLPSIIGTLGVDQMQSKILSQVLF